jgi:hypothetical protein
MNYEGYKALIDYLRTLATDEGIPEKIAMQVCRKFGITVFRKLFKNMRADRGVIFYNGHARPFVSSHLREQKQKLIYPEKKFVTVLEHIKSYSVRLDEILVNKQKPVKDSTANKLHTLLRKGHIPEGLDQASSISDTKDA